MRVHVYRNRPDDHRQAHELHYCTACEGWYGVPHVGSHCQKGQPSGPWRMDTCACRPCRESWGKPIEGSYGFFTDAPEWQP